MPNQLFYGDNLEVLRKHIRDETVDLCYIDPPFNSKRNYNQIYNNVGKEDQAQAQAFIDTWTWDDYANQGLKEIQENYQGRFTAQSIDLISGLTKVLGKGSLLAYLISMTLRIVEIHRVLKPTDSFYLHCDPTASHYLKIVLDAIFCAQGGDYKNEITWKRQSAHSDAKKKFCDITDIIFYFVKSLKAEFFPQYGKHDANYVEKFYRHDDNDGRGMYQLADMTSPNPRPNIMYEWLGFPYPPMGWRYQLVTMQKLHDEGRIYYPQHSDGRFDITKRPRLKRYLNEQEGSIITNIWTDIQSLTPHAAERLGYPTQKPFSLLERIIKASSNEGDVVLDAYCGCGTSVAVSQRLNRRWIGIDITYQSISLILKRLEDAFGKGVLENIVLNGIPKDMESAQALALKQDDRTRKEFEKWAVLTYSNNRAIINQKKGSDKGVDGIAYFTGDKDEPEKIILQVKSGKVNSSDIRDLQGTMTRESAALGVFITLNKPTKDMNKEAKEAGIYQSRFMSQPTDKIRIVTIQEIIEEQKRLDIRLSLEVLKSAEKQMEVRQGQLDLD